jgi:F-type H+-transporting ATPase subunit epsilon
VLPQFLRLVVVTPEKTLLDQPVSSLRFPLYDGSIGVLPGRAPLVGRLGYGELKINAEGRDRIYFIDGGFVQIKGETVSLLTHRAIPAGDINTAEAEEQLRQAKARPATTDIDQAAKARDEERARQMLAVARLSH